MQQLRTKRDYLPLDPDTPIPSIEAGVERCGIKRRKLSFSNTEKPPPRARTPIFHEFGVLVGYWYADSTGRGRRPVYCLMDDFEYVYFDDGKLVLVRWIDFDPLEHFGHWDGDDTESGIDGEENDQERPMTPEEVKIWVRTMWECRNFLDIA
ncbi:hypothetical protein BGW36DRAFT_303522 [Talaromyces proteolyticus]|uniref:Uncharacterized protein n=1 Tax=Talaromyces proteolyticus TaxID=1131652 RepID=A0AAD4PWR4_9EURO|nr:uncharacterized protein BGW36DRAFT_303522 [Talaromyces proteolyticus]KAH8691919.1 hypothetical protein BGW36DRAFT_303522 [Talaromyces proteolyticus]